MGPKIARVCPKCASNFSQKVVAAIFPSLAIGILHKNIKIVALNKAPKKLTKFWALFTEKNSPKPKNHQNSKILPNLVTLGNSKVSDTLLSFNDVKKA